MWPRANLHCFHRSRSRRSGGRKPALAVVHPVPLSPPAPTQAPHHRHCTCQPSWAKVRNISGRSYRSIIGPCFSRRQRALQQTQRALYLPARPRWEGGSACRNKRGDVDLPACLLDCVTSVGLRGPEMPSYWPCPKEKPGSPSNVYRFSVLMKSMPAAAARLSRLIICWCVMPFASLLPIKRQRQ